MYFKREKLNIFCIILIIKIGQTTGIAWNWDGAFGILTSLRAERSGILIPTATRDSSLLQKSQNV
jgi:hypothetical protein